MNFPPRLFFHQSRTGAGPRLLQMFGRSPGKGGQLLVTALPLPPASLLSLSHGIGVQRPCARLQGHGDEYREREDHRWLLGCPRAERSFCVWSDGDGAKDGAGVLGQHHPADSSVALLWQPSISPRATSELLF